MESINDVQEVMMNTEKIFNDAINFVKQKLDELEYPMKHPFNDYPHTPESMALQLIILFKALTNKDDMVVSFLKKCKSIENNDFSYTKYNQSISEIIWFIYIYTSLIESNAIDMLVEILGEDTPIYDNGKRFEYSFVFNDLNESKNLVITSEIKTITCDPFKKETGLKIIDGQKLIKPLFPELKDSDFLRRDPEAIVLQASTYYYQTEQNIKKIINKCRGKNVSGYTPFNIGILFINFSTSIKEFYSYIFHQSRGIYSKLLDSNVDALVLLSLDAHNALNLQNLYATGYVQTLLIHPTDRNKKLCNLLHIDNYLSIGSDIDEHVYELAQNEYGIYKILCRDGFLNIIPYDSTEDEIEQYVDYLKSNTIRY